MKQMRAPPRQQPRAARGAIPCRLAMAVLALGLSRRASALPDGGKPEELGSFTLIATGDIMMHEAVKQSAEDAGFAALFNQVAPLIQGADLAFGNLETPVAPKAGRGSHAFVFNAPVALLAALKQAGFGLVSFANNHAYDQGVAGVGETVGNLGEAGLLEIGAGRTPDEAQTPVIVERHGVKVGFLGCTARFNLSLNGEPGAKGFRQRPYVQPAEAEAMAAAVQRLAPTVDAVVVSVHWGNEYEAEPAEEQLALARRLVEAGALVVLGSHPHVLQRIEVIPGPEERLALVAFSLGNFISNQSREYVSLAPPAAGDTRDGALLRLQFRKRRYLGGQTVTELASTEALPIWTDNNTVQRKRAPHSPIDIHVVDLDRELKADRASLETLGAVPPPLAASQSKQAKALQQRIELLELRRARIGERLGNYLPPTQ